jgi:hypothetical protein
MHGRLEYLMDGLLLLEEVILEAMYDGRGKQGRFGGSHYPRRPISDEGKRDGEGRIPKGQLEEMIIQSYAFLARHVSLDALSKNIGYYSEERDKYLPPFNARAYSSMDCENQFSIFNSTAGIHGKFNKGKGTVVEAKAAMTKTILISQQEYQVKTIKTSTRTQNYTLPKFMKSEEQRLQWNNPVDGKISRRDKRGFLVRLSARYRYSPSTAAVCQPKVRSFHASNL